MEQSQTPMYFSTTHKQRARDRREGKVTISDSFKKERNTLCHREKAKTTRITDSNGSKTAKVTTSEKVKLVNREKERERQKKS